MPFVPLARYNKIAAMLLHHAEKSTPSVAGAWSPCPVGGSHRDGSLVRNRQACQQCRHKTHPTSSRRSATAPSPPLLVEKDDRFNRARNLEPDARWSQHFYERLTHLVVHPLLETAQRLLLALKWVVICQTDNRRPLSLPRCVSEGLFHHRSATSDQEFSKPYRE